MRSHDEAGVRKHKRAVIRGRHKLIVTEPQGRAELYDLYSDPSESVDLAAELAETRERLRALLAAQSQSIDPALHGPADVYLPSEAEARLLEELGYVEGAE